MHDIDVTISAEDLALIRQIAKFGPARVRALYDLATQFLEFEGDDTQGKAGHPVTTGAQLEEPIDHTITCPRRARAQAHSEPLPRCRWVRDGCGYSCVAKLDGASVCGGTIQPGMARHEALARRFGDIDASQPAPAGMRRFWVRAHVSRSAALPDGWWWLGTTSGQPSLLIFGGVIDAASEAGVLGEIERKFGSGVGCDVEPKPRDWEPTDAHTQFFG